MSLHALLEATAVTKVTGDLNYCVICRMKLQANISVLDLTSLQLALPFLTEDKLAVTAKTVTGNSRKTQQNKLRR